jgi:hypothetical protein
MAKKLQISSENIQRANSYGNQATISIDYRKAISVILVDEASLDDDQIAALPGTNRQTFS